MHLKIPHHNGRDWHDDDVHQDGKAARYKYERARVYASAAWYNVSVGIHTIHGWLVPDVIMWSTLNQIDDS